MTQFTTFLGIDQTGATDSKGVAKPLPVALLCQVGPEWKLHFSEKSSRLEISSLTRQNLLELLSNFPHPGRDLSRTALVLDSVFGLPKRQWPFSQGGSEKLFELFQKASRFSHNGKAYGRDTAEHFFREFLQSYSGSRLPQRLCEIESGANSIFLTRPYQRNIGCGTFRIWKELGSVSEKWFQVWGFDEPAPQLQDGPWIFEAYPTLFWKKILGSPTRKASELVRWLSTESPLRLKLPPSQRLLLMEDPDLCDSVVLAVCAWILQERNEIWTIPQFSGRQKEGWILGL